MAQLGRFVRDFLTPTLVIVLCSIVAYDHFAVHQLGVGSVGVNGKALGRKFAGSVGSSLGDAWSAAAETLEQGKTVAEAQTVLQAHWQDARARMFAAEVSPEFARVLPEGSEPTSPIQRATVVKLWRDFAAGLKGGR